MIFIAEMHAVVVDDDAFTGTLGWLIATIAEYIPAARAVSDVRADREWEGDDGFQPDVGIGSVSALWIDESVSAYREAPASLVLFLDAMCRCDAPARAEILAEALLRVADPATAFEVVDTRRRMS